MNNYVDQYPEGLSYHLFFVPKDFNLETLGLTKIKSGQTKIHGLFVEIWIIGESHLLCVVLPNGRRLVEVFACVELDPPFKLLAKYNAAELFSTMAFYVETPNFNYNLDVTKGSMAKIAQISDEETALFLEVVFPADKNGITGKTQVSIKETKKGFEFHSYHGYPNCDAAVTTYSILEV